MVSSAISTVLVGIALWAAYAVMRTAVELRNELRVPVRETPRTPHLPQARSHYRRGLRSARRSHLRRAA